MPSRQWTVRPHGKLSQIDDGIMTVVGEIRMPLTMLPRRMTVVRLADGRLVVWSAIALDDEGMATLEAFGRPAFMIVPNDHHRLDARAWKDRYPQIHVVAPEGAKTKVAEVVPVDTTSPNFGGPDVQFVAVPGTNSREAALVVNRPSGTTLVLNDIVGNIRNPASLGGWFLRFTRFAGDKPQIPKPVKWAMIRDAAALRAQLLQWADIKSLRRVLVSHGDSVEGNPQQALRELAASLA